MVHGSISERGEVMGKWLVCLATKKRAAFFFPSTRTPSTTSAATQFCLINAVVLHQREVSGGVSLTLFIWRWIRSVCFVVASSRCGRGPFVSLPFPQNFASSSSSCLSHIFPDGIGERRMWGARRQGCQVAKSALPGYHLGVYETVGVRGTDVGQLDIRRFLFCEVSSGNSSGIPSPPPP